MERELSWEIRGAAPTLAGIRAYVEEVSRDLDPGSRYPAELLAVLAASSDVDDYLRRLEDPARLAEFRTDGSRASGGERGRSWVDAETWGGMDPYERTLANLLTGETRMMWAGEGARDFARLGEVLAALAGPHELLSIPCATGKEAFSLAIAALRARMDEVRVVGVDRQASYLARARSGLLVAHARDLELEGASAHLLEAGGGRVRVAPAVLERCRFERGDVLTGALPPGPFALVSCRNLLGYFRGERLETAWRNVAARVRPGGVLLLDPFVTGAPEMAPVRRLLEEAGYVRRFADASHFDAPPR